MIIIGVDYHPEFQQVAWVDSETGEFQEAQLQHREAAEQFYRELAKRQVAVRIGMEASGHARWLEQLFGELQFELWIGDATRICSQRVRKRKTDRQDAQLILQLLVEGRFPRTGCRVRRLIANQQKNRLRSSATIELRQCGAVL